MKNFKTIILVIAAVIVTWTLKDCTSKDSPVVPEEEDEYTVVKAIRDSLVEEYQPKYEYLLDLAEYKDSLARDSKDQAEYLSRELARAKRKKDTVRIVEYQDSIITVKDTVIVELELAGRVKDSLIDIQHNLIVNLDSLVSINDSLYYELDQNYKEKVAESEKRRKQRNRARIAVGVVAVFEIVRISIKNIGK